MIYEADMISRKENLLFSIELDDHQKNVLLHRAAFVRSFVYGISSRLRI